MLLDDTNYHSSRRCAAEVVKRPSGRRSDGAVLGWVKQYCERLFRAAVAPPSTTFYMFGVETERSARPGRPSNPGVARSTRLPPSLSK